LIFPGIELGPRRWEAGYMDKFSFISVPDAVMGEPPYIVDEIRLSYFIYV
jgi:hypothetical protein